MFKVTCVIGITKENEQEILQFDRYSKEKLIEAKNSGKFKRILVYRTPDESYNCKPVIAELTPADEKPADEKPAEQVNGNESKAGKRK